MGTVFIPHGYGNTSRRERYSFPTGTVMLPHENGIVSRTERQNFPSGTVMPAPTTRKLPAGNGIFRGRHTTNPIISLEVRYLGPPVRANRLAFAPWPLAHTRVPACEAPSALRRGATPPTNREGQTPSFTCHDYRTGGEEHSVGRSRRPRLGRARRWWPTRGHVRNRRYHGGGEAKRSSRGSVHNAQTPLPRDALHLASVPGEGHLLLGFLHHPLFLVEGALARGVAAGISWNRTRPAHGPSVGRRGAGPSHPRAGPRHRRAPGHASVPR
jgi:hypothetical protein